MHPSISSLSVMQSPLSFYCYCTICLQVFATCRKKSVLELVGAGKVFRRIIHVHDIFITTGVGVRVESSMFGTEYAAAGVWTHRVVVEYPDLNRLVHFSFYLFTNNRVCAV